MIEGLPVNRLTRLSAVGVAGVLLLFGCSDASDPANFEPNGLASNDNPVEIFQEGAETTVDSDDVTVTGTVTVNGARSEMTSRFGGSKAESVVTSRKSEYQVKANDRTIYVRGNSAFWTDLVGRSQASSIGDRWVVSPKDGPLAPFNYFVDLNSFFRASGNIKKGKAVQIEGRPAITIVDPPKGTDSVWAFATTGEPVAFSFKSGSTTALTFDYTGVNLIDMPNPADSVPVEQVRIPKSKQR
jgi:hypothetical protein